MCGEQSRWPAKRGENGEAHGQRVAISFPPRGRQKRPSCVRLGCGGRDEEADMVGVRRVSSTMSFHCEKSSVSSICSVSSISFAWPASVIPIGLLGSIASAPPPTHVARLPAAERHRPPSFSTVARTSAWTRFATPRKRRSMRPKSSPPPPPRRARATVLLLRRRPLPPSGAPRHALRAGSGAGRASLRPQGAGVLSIGGHRYHVDARAVGAHGVGLNEEVKYLLESN